MYQLNGNIKIIPISTKFLSRIELFSERGSYLAKTVGMENKYNRDVEVGYSTCEAR